MRFICRAVIAAGTIGMLLATARDAEATDFFVYRAKLKIVAKMVIFNPVDNDTIVTRKLGNNDIINLALGRAPGTKVDAKTEILAGAGTYADHAAESTLIVFDPSQNGLGQIKATVGTISSIEFNNAYLASKSQGSGSGTTILAATTLGNPTAFGFVQSTFNCGGEGSGTHDPFGGGSKVSGKGSLFGRLRFNDANASPASFDGFVVKAEAKVSGKPIGGFTK
jgi:hypothetical protein